MRKSRYTDEQMVKILRETDRSPVADVAKKHGVSEQTIYAWRKRFGTMTASDTKRLRAPEQENGRLKKLVAKRDLETRGHERRSRQETGRRARATAAGCVRLGARPRPTPRVRASQHRARFAALCIDPSAGRCAGRDAHARARDQYLRYGYRRIRLFLGRDGHTMSPARAHRLWRGARLQVLRKRPRRHVAGARPKPPQVTGANQGWAYDFVFDACPNGQLRYLTVIDEYTREALAIDLAGSIRSGRVIDVRRLISIHRVPRALPQRQWSGVRVARDPSLAQHQQHRLRAD